MLNMIIDPASVPKHVAGRPSSSNPKKANSHISTRRFLNLDELKARPAPADMVSGLFREKSLIVIHGRAKSGKTYLVVDLLCAVANGTSFLGNDVTGGRAVYVCLEGVDEIPDRIRAWEARHSAVPPDRLQTDKDPLNLLDDEAVTGFISALEEKQNDEDPISLVVIDTLSRAMAGAEENSSTSMSALVRSCDRIRDEAAVAVVLVHHTPKGETSTTMRGHSSLEGACGLGLYVSNSNGNRSALVQMNRAGPEGTPYNFKLVDQSFTRDDGTTGSDLVVDFVGISKTSTTANGGLKKKRQVDLDADTLQAKLKKAMQENGQQGVEDTDGNVSFHGSTNDLETAKAEMKKDLTIDSDVPADNVRARATKAVERLKKRSQLEVQDSTIIVTIPPPDPAENEPPF